MIERIGFEGTGSDIEFEMVKEADLAYLVCTLDDRIQVWLPKSVFTDDGSLNDQGCELFLNNYSKAIGKGYSIEKIRYALTKSGMNGHDQDYVIEELEKE